MIKEFFALYGRPRVIAILFLGFASGLPLALTASTLTAWLAESGIQKSSIGLFAAIATPYALKFLWSPLVDGLRIPILCPWLGRRRGWLAATQIALALSLLLLGTADPSVNVTITALCALLVAIASATQDIIIDAYRVELLPAEEQGVGAAAGMLGYRIGMIVSSAGALYCAAWFGWQAAYWIMASLLGVGMIAALFAGEPKASEKESANRPKLAAADWFKEYVVAPFTEFMRREHWLAILLFIMLYKLADAFIGIMSNPFLLEIGFSKEEIASVVKVYGLIATIIGSFIGGAMIARLGVVRSLWICGVAHALTNLMYMLQAHVGADIHILALGISMENISGGMGLAAFVAFISMLCNRHFTATQYALLTSISAMGRTLLSTPAGWVAQTVGWELFFVFATLLAIPGLAVLAWLGKRIKTD